MELKCYGDSECVDITYKIHGIVHVLVNFFIYESKRLLDYWGNYLNVNKMCTSYLNVGRFRISERFWSMWKKIFIILHTKILRTCR